MTETWFSKSCNVLSVLQLQGSNLPLDESFWSNEDLKDPKKLYEATVLLNARRETSEKILVEQLEAKLEQNKVGNIGLKSFLYRTWDDQIFFAPPRYFFVSNMLKLLLLHTV